MIKIIVLCGKTSSGKTTVLNELEKLGIERIVTMTTRPMRPGEVEGKTYYFRGEDEFKRLMDYDFFAETTSYQVANGATWYYGTPKEKLFGDGAIILNPDGLKALRGKYPMCVFYLDVPRHELLKRLKARGDDKDEASRRLAADENDFADIQDYIDWIIGDYWSSPDWIAAKIKKQYEIWCDRKVNDMKILSLNDQKLLNEAEYIRKKYGCSTWRALQIRRRHRDIDLDSKEMKAYTSYDLWCQGWYGNKSIERFISTHPEYKDIHLDI